MHHEDQNLKAFFFFLSLQLQKYKNDLSESQIHCKPNNESIHKYGGSNRLRTLQHYVVSLLGLEYVMLCYQKCFSHLTKSHIKVRDFENQTFGNQILASRNREPELKNHGKRILPVSWYTKYQNIINKMTFFKQRYLLCNT